jgi:hypothetical protein
MSPLVSVIIPCHNAENWVAKSIRSALDQTHQPIEVIVIDNGSTDGSLDAIRSFGDKIIWESSPDRGANYALNRGLDLAHGEFIQFLDAADYLLPEKIQRQLKVLRASDADVIYEDWRRREDHKDGSCRFFGGISGAHRDILEAGLSNWVPQVPTLLYTRQTFERNIRWNERLTFAQDWEMHIRLAMAGVKYRYLPGCFSVIRCLQPNGPAANSRLMEDNIVAILKEAETHLRAMNGLNERYRHAMARAYLALACGANQYFDTDRPHFEELFGEAQRLSPSTIYPYSVLYAATAKLFGVRNAERLRSWKRRHLKQLPEPQPAPLPTAGAAR